MSTIIYEADVDERGMAVFIVHPAAKTLRSGVVAVEADVRKRRVAVYVVHPCAAILCLGP